MMHGRKNIKIYKHVLFIAFKGHSFIFRFSYTTQCDTDKGSRYLGRNTTVILFALSAFHI